MASLPDVDAVPSCVRDGFFDELLRVESAEPFSLLLLALALDVVVLFDVAVALVAFFASSDEMLAATVAVCA